MTINFLYRVGDTFPHSMGQGFIDALESLGHTVRSFKANLNSVNQKPLNKDMLGFLKSPADLILVRPRHSRLHGQLQNSSHHLFYGIDVLPYPYYLEIFAKY
jgi:hypothetical protein